MSLYDEILWYKQACKAADFLFEVKPDKSFWSPDRHEPLIIVICFPFLRFKPWQLRNSSALLEVGRILRSVQEDSEAAIRAVLWELCLFTRRLYPMSKGVVWEVLQGRPSIQVPHPESRE